MALQLLLFLLLLLCGRLNHADGNLLARIYWETVLPNTPMPPTVRDYFYPQAATHGLQHKASLFHSASKHQQFQEKDALAHFAIKSNELQDDVTFIYSDTKPHELQDDITFIYSDTNPQQLQEEGSVIYSDTKSYELQDDASFIYSDTNPQQLQEEVQVIYSDTKPYEQQEKDNAIALHKLQGKITRSTFFFEKDLFPGANLTLKIMNHDLRGDLLPRRVAHAFPFSSAKLPEILALLGIDPKSREAKRMRRTLHACEAPAIAGETKFCATSLESMMDFIVSYLGTSDLQAFSTVTTSARGADSPTQAYTVTGGLRRIADVGTRSVVCHSMEYAYAVFACHDTGSSVREYAVTMTGSADAARVEMVAMCHADTSAWSPGHIAFEVLGVKPGTEPICHLVSPGTLLWLPTKQSQEKSRESK